MLGELFDLNDTYTLAGAVAKYKAGFIKLPKKRFDVAHVVGQHLGFDPQRAVLKPTFLVGEAPQASEEQPR